MMTPDALQFAAHLKHWRLHFEALAEQRLAEHVWCEMLGKEHDCDEDCPARPPQWARALRAQMAEATNRALRVGPAPASHDPFIDAVSGLPPVGTPGEVAVALALHPRTVRRFVELGQLRAIDLGAGGGRGRSSALRIPRLSVLSFLRRKAGVPEGPSGARKTRPRPRNP